jgi:hypothetical protein
MEDVAVDHVEIGVVGGEGREAPRERAIELDGEDGDAGGGEEPSHFAVAGADFQPGSLRRRSLQTDGAGNLLTPAGIGEEMLAEALTGHLRHSLAGMACSTI